MSSTGVNGASARPAPEGRFAGLALRAASALVLAPLVLAIIHFGSPWFEGLLVIAAVIMAWEWFGLCGRRPVWLAAGAFYVAVPIVALGWLRAHPDDGREVIFWVFALIWAADTGAYVFGRLIGGPKLAPRLSPKKTWAGMAGAVTWAGAVGWGAAVVLEAEATLAFTLFSGLLGAVGQGGDLFESWVKRRFGAKDSGNIIPGHGGILDRVDGLMAVAIVVAAVTALGDGGVLTWR